MTPIRIIIGERNSAMRRRPANQRYVLAAQIFEHRVAIHDVDTRMPARHPGRINEAASRVATDDVFAITKRDIAACPRDAAHRTRCDNRRSVVRVTADSSLGNRSCTWSF